MSSKTPHKPPRLYKHKHDIDHDLLPQRPSTPAAAGNMAKLLSVLVSAVLALVLLTCSTTARSPRSPILRFANRESDVANVDPPRHSTGLSDSVQWDNYTLWVDGQRIFLQYAPEQPIHY